MTLATRIPVSLVLPLVLGSLAGCEAAFESAGELDLGKSVHAETCPPWECGSNSAELNELPIGELHLFPGQNTGNISAWNARIIGFQAPPTAPGGPGGYTLHVSHGRFSATKGPTTLVGNALLGSQIFIENTSDQTTVTLHIHAHETIPSWTDTPFLTDRYVLTWFDANLGENVPVCTNAEDTAVESAWAVLISGERYSWSAKSVTATGQAGAGWFNIACVDNALYEMKLMGYDPQPTTANPHQTTANQRQATLKMLTADYCGTGASFTETGTPLYWINQAGWSLNSTPPATTSEGYWGHLGALCLDAPRLGPAELEAIQTECARVGKVLSPCSSFTGTYEWITENPQ